MLAALVLGANAHAGNEKDPLAEAYKAISKEDVLKVDAAAVWQAQCSSCHGRDGKGQTRVGRRAGAKDFTDHEYQKSFSDELAFHYTKTGLTRDGRELMKPFGKGLSEDEGLTDAEIKALVGFLRKFDEKWKPEMNAAIRSAELKKGKEEKAAE